MTTERADPAALAEVMAEERGLTVVEPRPSTQVAIFGTDDPAAIAQRVIAIAEPLAEFIKQKGMSTTISGREYVLAEGWSFAGSLLGVAPRTVRVVDIDGGYEAEVELLVNGQVISGAIAECTRSERSWANRDGYALKSMAQTRAMGKAFRMAFGFVVKAAGFEVTPAEEMPPPSEVRTPRQQRPEPQPRPGQGEQVPVVPEMVNGPTMLFRWAAETLGASQEWVLEFFDLKVVGDLPRFVREQHNNDWQEVVAALSGDVMTRPVADDEPSD